MLRRIIAALTVATVVSASPALGHTNGQTDTARDDFVSRLRENNNSNVFARARIDGTHFVARATGLNPNNRYISLYYADVSTAEPDQANTCADPRTAADVRSWNVRGEWTVRRDGTGVLHSTAARKVTTDPRSITVSIRRVPDTALGDPFIAFNPVQYPVVACGRIVRP